MKAVSKILAGGVAFAALASAAPAAAQYYPGYGQPNPVGQVINQILGGGYGQNTNQIAVQRCAAAVEQRINYQYNRYGAQGGYSGYGGYNPGYNPGYNGYQHPSSARVLAVTSIERRSGSGLRIRGIATAHAQPVGYGGYNGGYSTQGGYGGYGQGGYAPNGGYGQPHQPGELTFRCNLDYRGYVTDVNLDRNRYAYGGYRNY